MTVQDGFEVGGGRLYRFTAGGTAAAGTGDEGAAVAAEVGGVYILDLLDGFFFLSGPRESSPDLTWAL